MKKIVFWVLLSVLAACNQPTNKEQDPKATSADDLVRQSFQGTRTKVPSYQQILEERKQKAKK